MLSVTGGAILDIARVPSSAVGWHEAFKGRLLSDGGPVLPLLATEHGFDALHRQAADSHGAK